MKDAAPAQAGRQFHIDGDLLADQTGGWRNLGDWSATDDYREAAEALAIRVGEAAGLRAGMSVLDLACGFGASLSLWQHRFGVTRVAGLELQAACIDALRPLVTPTFTIAQGRFDQPPLPAALLKMPFDAVVCVDAAYHARSLQAFSSIASSALVKGGRLAFTTLARASAMLSPGLTLALKSAGIPPSTLPGVNEITRTLSDMGYTAIHVESLDHDVLEGFGRYVRRRAKALPLYHRTSLGWLKIRATGWLCDNLMKNRELHYVLVQAQLS